MEKNFSTIDGNTAATHVAYAFSEVAAIYPITPSSGMGEMADEWSAHGKKNLFDEEVDVIEMQSEAGASGAVHGSLSGGAMTTTFTASQGLLLMIPNMHKIAGEMLPTVFHVSARSLACQSLSIFGDHSDVMSVRNTGFALMAANSVQEVQDLAIVSHLATLESKVPFLNFFDGFRTSSEIQKVEQVDYDTMKSMLDMKHVEEFRDRGLRPEKPIAKVGAQNPDVYFQGRETVNRYYAATPEIVKRYMKLVAEKIGRTYNLFDYAGAKDAEKIIVGMGSAMDTVEETVEYMNKNGAKVGLIKVRLYRPFAEKDFVAVLPGSVKKIAVIDRTKEPGSMGEPLYVDVVTALKGKNLHIIGGRYGLSSKEFTPAMVKAIYDHLDKDPKDAHGFTVGINDDVSNSSIEVKEDLDVEPEGTIRCKFWGLGSDGTVSANKNSIKIIGNNTDMYAQGYFVYDSKKSGGITISHLRFGKEKIKAPYLLTTSDFIALHNHSYIGRYDILDGIKEGGVFLLNSAWKPEEVFGNLTQDMQKTIIEKKVKVYNIDALKIANEVGLGNRINTVMQVAFFKLANVMPVEKAIELIKKAIEKQFKKKGDNIVKMNWDAVDKALEGLAEVNVPDKADKSVEPKKLISDDASDFAKEVIQPIMHLKGDSIPVSKMPLDGKVPTGTTRLEKRGIATQVPRWISENCIQCGQCSFVCPHASIRIKQIKPKSLEGAPESFKAIKSNTKNDKDLQYKVQIYPEDCTGCGSCVEVCPAKNKAIVMTPIEQERAAGEVANAEFFDSLPDNITDGAPITMIKGTQLKQPLFEFSGACAGCGETPYIKLVTQLFGDRMIIANATGCSSIYGGTFPTIPYCQTKDGKGPSWANSLFEDNAEYGYGMRLAVNANRKQLLSNVKKLLEQGVNDELKSALQYAVDNWNNVDDAMKKNADKIKELLAKEQGDGTISKVKELQDYFVDKSVWIIGGDGWAYDIGYGGLDHVLASGKNVNVLVVDTEVYSNTGGQASKATPMGATAKFAASGKKVGKKDLGHMMMSYGNVYVASVNMGGNMMQVIKAMIEAENYDGPSIIIAYAPCIAHGINMGKSIAEEKLAMEAGHWPIYRYDPRLAAEGKNPLQWQTPEPKKPLRDYIMNETRYKTLMQQMPEEAEKLFTAAEKDAKRRMEHIKSMADKKE